MSEQTIIRELQRRADDVHAAALTLDSVRGRARAIRRRRRAAAAAAVAAVVALVLVLPGVLGGHGDRTVEPAPAPSPQTAVLHNGVVTLPDGAHVAIGVDAADVGQLGVLSDGRIVLAMLEPYAVRVYGTDGELDEQYDVQANVITMSADRSAVAWVGEDFTVRVLASGSPEPTTLPGIPMPGEAAGGIDAVLDANHLLVGDHTTTTEELTPDGLVPLNTKRQFRVLDVSPDGTLWAVAFIPTVEHEQYGCSGLYDPATDEMRARSCAVSGLRFAPDGQHVLSLRGDNNMYAEAATYDLDLRPVGTYAPPGRSTVVSRAAWADPTHLLVAVTDWRTSEWSLVRVGNDGSQLQTLEGPIAGRNPESVAEFVLSE